MTSTDLTGMTRDEAIAAARDLAQGLVARRDETEALRRLPDESMKELVASGLRRVNQSKRWGGPAVMCCGSVSRSETAVEVIAEVAKGDTSAGWVCGLIASHFWLICLFSPEVQEEIWGDDNAAMMSSSFAPSQGTCERVDGGYRIRGRWPWS